MLKTALKMTEKSKKILLLFDIDGTLINSKYSGNQQKRPSGLYLVKAAAQVFLGDASKYHRYIGYVTRTLSARYQSF